MHLIGRSIAIEYLFDSEITLKVKPLYVFFDYKDVQNQTAKNVMASLLKQLIYAKQSIPCELEKMYDEDKKEKRRPSLDAFVQLFTKQTKEISFIVLFDAFDECGEQQTVQCQLIRRFYNSGLKIFITHRPHILKTPEADFREWTRVDIQARDEDIERYVKTELDTKAKERQLDSSLRARIMREIKSRANGMYGCS